uniref:Uncharacterized protein n=1 Tax=Romanomermis culicivorax TaxID=13658 RepID=A0A915HS77_ROMCU
MFSSKKVNFCDPSKANTKVQTVLLLTHLNTTGQKFTNLSYSHSNSIPLPPMTCYLKRSITYNTLKWQVSLGKFLILTLTPIFSLPKLENISSRLQPKKGDRKKSCKCRLREKELRCNENSTSKHLSFFCQHDHCGEAATTVRFVNSKIRACMKKEIETFCPEITKIIIFDEKLCNCYCQNGGKNFKVRIAAGFEVLEKNCTQ